MPNTGHLLPNLLVNKYYFVPLPKYTRLKENLGGINNNYFVMARLEPSN